MRAGEPGTETPSPNTGLDPPLNPNRLISDTVLTLTGLLHCSCCCGNGSRCIWHARIAALAGASAATHGTLSTSFIDVPPGTSSEMLALQPAPLLPTLHFSSGNLHHSRWALRERRSGCLVVRAPNRRLDFCQRRKHQCGGWCWVFGERPT